MTHFIIKTLNEIYGNTKEKRDYINIKKHEFTISKIDILSNYVQQNGINKYPFTEQPRDENKWLVNNIMLVDLVGENLLENSHFFYWLLGEFSYSSSIYRHTSITSESEK